MIVAVSFFNTGDIASPTPSQATSGLRLIPHAYINVSFLANLFRMVFPFTWLPRQLVRFPSTCKNRNRPYAHCAKKTARRCSSTALISANGYRFHCGF